MRNLELAFPRLNIGWNVSCGISTPFGCYLFPSPTINNGHGRAEFTIDKLWFATEVTISLLEFWALQEFPFYAKSIHTIYLFRNNMLVGGKLQIWKLFSCLLLVNDKLFLTRCNFSLWHTRHSLVIASGYSYHHKKRSYLPNFILFLQTRDHNADALQTKVSSSYFQCDDRQTWYLSLAALAVLV